MTTFTKEQCREDEVILTDAIKFTMVILILVTLG
jgi:hypothetical protein